MPSDSRRAAFLGLSAAVVMFFWQFLTVHFIYGGNWTGLFCIRPGMPVPAFLKSEHLYVFNGSEGYDGQVYHLIAHDPWMRKGSPEAIAGAAFRYQRIFVPALAWILAFGQDRWIHPAYFTVILGFIFLGVYWMLRFAVRAGQSAAWGLLFALTPAALTSVDRMTVDVALAAFTVGFALYCETVDLRVLAILACAALTRETALPIIAAYAVYLLTRKEFRNAIFAAGTALPALAWFLFLRRRHEPAELAGYVRWTPLAGFVQRVLHPVVYHLSPFRNAMARAFDQVALAGVALALIFAARLALRRRWDPRSCVVYALAGAVIFLDNREVWEDVYAFGRVLTPFVMLTALQDLSAHPWRASVPMLLIDSRLGLYFALRALNIVRAITHW